MNIKIPRHPLKILRILYLIPVFVFITSCVGNTKIPQDHYYRLPEIESSTVYSSPVLVDVISIDSVLASGVLDERDMLYVEEDKPDEVKYYAYRHWMDAPSKLIRQHLINYLEKTRAVSVSQVTYEEGMEGGRVIVSLLRFERSVGEDDIKALVSLRIRYKPHGQREIQKTYSVAMEASDKTVYSTVNAFGLSLEAIYDEWLADIKRNN